eukprot:10120085-Alexandrium_andersonii.AAC.1
MHLARAKGKGKSELRTPRHATQGDSARSNTGTCSSSSAPKWGCLKPRTNGAAASREGRTN